MNITIAIERNALERRKESFINCLFRKIFLKEILCSEFFDIARSKVSKPFIKLRTLLSSTALT